MKGHFSIEWMAQSSQAPAAESEQPAGTATGTTGPATCGTHSESLPGFYCRQKFEEARSLDGFSQEQTSQSDQATTEPGLSSATEEETSGYESEGVRSPSPSSPSSRTPGSPPAGRRPRTAFTAEQISTMEKAFKRNAYLGTQDKAELCKKLSLSDKQIRNWFQNRRMKLKRTVQDALAHACQASVASQLMHYPELQTYRSGPYPRYHAAAPAVGAAPEVPPPISYVHPHGLQYGSALPSISNHPYPLDSYYQYSSLPGAALPTSSTQVAGSYPTYPQYY